MEYSLVRIKSFSPLIIVRKLGAVLSCKGSAADQTDSQVDASRRKFTKPELAYGLAMGGQTDFQVGFQVHASRNLRGLEGPFGQGFKDSLTWKISLYTRKITFAATRQARVEEILIENCCETLIVLYRLQKWNRASV